MARIPVERKQGQGIPWWAWLLLALAIGALFLWLFFALFDNDRAAEGSLPAGGNQAPAATGPITDLATIFNAPNKQALVGREVQITGANVRTEPMPNVYWIGPRNPQSNEQVLFVVRGAEAPVEGGPVTEGATISFNGKILKAPSMDEARTLWPGLSAENFGDLQKQELYVQADRITVTGP